MRNRKSGRVFGGFSPFGAKPSSGAVVTPPVTLDYPLNPSLWRTKESVEDAFTRRVFVEIPSVPQLAGYILGVYRGTEQSGNLTQIGTMTYAAGGYSWRAADVSVRGSTNYTRIAKRPADLSDPWTWLSGPSDTKPFTISDVPKIPSGTWSSPAPETIDVTLAPWDGQRRDVTGGEYRINQGAWTAFSTSAAGLATVLHLTGLTGDVEATLDIRYVNANTNASVTAPYLRLLATPGAIVPPPPAPQISYLVDGSGTGASAYLEHPDVDLASIINVRYRFDGGPWVYTNDPQPIPLTGLNASQTFEAQWANEIDFSESASVTLYAALPAPADLGWTAVNNPSAAGDQVALAIPTPPTPPAPTITLDGWQWTQDNGITWNAFIASPISTGHPDTTATIKIRAIYSIGPGVPSGPKSVKPGYPAPSSVTEYPTVTGPVVTNGGNGNVASKSINLPANVAGDKLIVITETGGDISVTLSGGWTTTRIGTGTFGHRMYMHERTTTVDNETTTLSFASSAGHVAAHAFKVTGGGDRVLSAAISIGTTATLADIADTFFGALPQKAHMIAAIGNPGANSGQSATIGDGFSARTSTLTATNTYGVRLATSWKQAEVTHYDPPAWPDNMAKCLAFLVAFLPEASVLPVANLVVNVSASTIEQGDSVTFTMTADGDGPIDFTLVMGTFVETNQTGVFVVSPPGGTNTWTATATNSAGSDSDTGSVVVSQNMVFSISQTSIFDVTFDAASIAHNVTPATYDLEWGPVAGPTVVVNQASPAFAITFPANGAYKARARGKTSGGTPGTWGDWVYYAPMVIGGISFPIQNAQAVQISPLTPTAPVEAVPVAGRSVRLHEPRPALDVGVWQNSAKGTLTFSATVLPVDGETITIGSITYTLKAALTGAPNEVKIGTTNTSTASNLKNAINGGSGAGTNYGAGTVANSAVSASSSGAVVSLTARTPGSSGNLIATTETTGAAAFGRATLSGGGSVNYTMHGVAINPAAPSGSSYGGYQFWDSRQGDGGELDATSAGFFSAAKLQTVWPAALALNDTVAKAMSRPTPSLHSTGNGQGYRMGIIDQHAGLVVLAALSTSSPMQSAPSLIKESGWTPGNVALPGWSALLSLITSTALSTSGMTIPETNTLRSRMGRFDPVQKLMRGGNYWQNSQEAVAPYQSCPTVSNGNYYKYINDAEVATLLISDAVDNDWKREMLGNYVLRGINSDLPGNSVRMGAGINQALMLPVALARIARGLDFLDLGTSQMENIPFVYGYWDATTLDYLNPHTSSARPCFSYRRQILSLLPDTASGHNFMVYWDRSAGDGRGESKQRMDKLLLVRESTGEALPWRATAGDMLGIGSEKFATTGFFSTPLAVGEYVYLKIPDTAMGAFAVGQPFWMYGEVGRQFQWSTFNPSPSMSYRDINEPQGKLMLLHALGAWPNIAGSNWNACREYTIKTINGGWPGPGLTYGNTSSSTFVSAFWSAHKATLGLATV